MFFRADEDFESFDVAENIEPNDFAPSDRAENIDLIDRPDSDLKEANEIVSPAMEPEIDIFYNLIQIIIAMMWLMSYDLYLHVFCSAVEMQS